MPCAYLSGVRSLVLLAVLAGCSQLGVVSDGTSVSVGRSNKGKIVDGVRCDRGEGFVVPKKWRERGNRYGTDELVDLIVGLGRRLHGPTRLAVADLSMRGGGLARPWHRSHQSGRDVDLLYYVRDAQGKPFEPEEMYVFNAAGVETTGTGITIDFPRTWKLVRELVTAPEASVQRVFMYEPFAVKLLEHAVAIGEPELLVARARKALKQPGDSAKHDDHIHVRVFCSATDQMMGCEDGGPMDMLIGRDEEIAAITHALAVKATAAVAATALPSGAIGALCTPTPAQPVCVRHTVPPHLTRLAALLGGGRRIDLRWL